jgi:hypothetical protein
MSDFGHHGFRVGNAFMDSWGAGPFTVGTDKKKWTFEFSDRFGPLLIGKDGMPLDQQPMLERDPFWIPFRGWLAARAALKGSDG